MGGDHDHRDLDLVPYLCYQGQRLPPRRVAEPPPPRGFRVVMNAAVYVPPDTTRGTNVIHLEMVLQD